MASPSLYVASVDPELPSGSRLVRASGHVTQSRHGGAGSAPALAVVHGGDRDSRLALAGAINPTLDQLVCPMPTSQAQWAAVVREAGVRGCAVVVENDVAPRRTSLERNMLASVLQRVRGMPYSKSSHASASAGSS